jgi:hypothetical protein
MGNHEESRERLKRGYLQQNSGSSNGFKALPLPVWMEGDSIAHNRLDLFCSMWFDDQAYIHGSYQPLRSLYL